MNYKMVLYILGWVLKIEAAIMVLPCLVAAVYRESHGFYLLGVAVLCAGLGWFLSYKKPKNTVYYAKEGFVSVSLSWIVMSFFGALPFFLSREIPNIQDAMFETISGFTTTGSSILENVEGLSRGMLMWRSLTHWIGGMGVLVFLLAVLPLAGGYNIHIMRAESPGPSVGKLVPKVKSTAKILYCMYLAMTLTQIVLLLLGGMHWFDSLCITFGSAGTGGFGILNDSMGSYTIYQQAVTTIFMILFGVNFNVYYLFLIHRPKDALLSEEARSYLGIILLAILIITWNVRGYFGNILLAFHHSAFQVATIISTTGYSTTDFNQWPTLSKSILTLLMFFGACAGSTAGGLKISRVVIAFKTVVKEMAFLLHGGSIKVLKFEGKVIEHNILRSINAYIIIYFLIFGISVLLVSIENKDLVTTSTAVISTFNNIGPGLGEVGPMGNFYHLSALSKLVLMFDMLAGRLEIFPLLLLFSPKTWSSQ